MTDSPVGPRSESTMPTVGQRFSLALSLLHPEADDLDASVSGRVSNSHGLEVTSAHIASLRAGDVDSVPAPIVAAVVDSVQISQEVLLGDDPDIVLPAWNSLQALEELNRTSPALVQLRSGAELSPQARADLLNLLDPSRKTD